MGKSIGLVGPVEPTGMSWLINCLLELNLKCSIDEQTWDSIGIGSKLNPSKGHLRRWLPALQDLNRTFKFEEICAISWSHDWFDQKHLHQKTIFFTREPKTAFYSGYKRLGNTEMSFSDYLLEIDPKWLLNRMQLWNLFHATWSFHPDIKFFFFEDYKGSPLKTLKSVLEWIEISGEGATIFDANHAIESSTWERAKLSEEAYLRELSINSPEMIRTGSTLIENEKIEMEAYELIDRECGGLNALIRGGNPIDPYNRAGMFNSHMIELLRNSRNPTPIIFENKENDFRFTGIGNLTERSFQISRKNKSESHLIASVQRQIVRNFKDDLELIFQIKYGSSKSSRTKFCIHSLKAMTEIIAGKLRRHFRQATPAEQMPLLVFNKSEDI